METIGKLHIISFDVPYPANYGGVMDVFYKVRALHDLGVKVTLHCFQYGDRGVAPILEQFCESVHYYPRKQVASKQVSLTPYITHSREDKDLLKNLTKDNAPILFEGLHCCAFIAHKALKGRRKLIRMHNIEWKYYRNLALLEKSFLKRSYYWLESKKLRRYENKALNEANSVLAISQKDYEYFSQLFTLSRKVVAISQPTSNVSPPACFYVPPFHPNTTVDIKRGVGDYVLFQGKLSVVDNELVALYLMERVFSKMEIRFVVAGTAPSPKLYEAAKKHKHIEIIADPSETAMNDLIANAQIHIVLSFQVSGMKLKLLNALFKGRFCIVNDPIIQFTGLESLCIIANKPKEIRQAIESYMNIQFSDKLVSERKDILEVAFSNRLNGALICQALGFG